MRDYAKENIKAIDREIQKERQKELLDRYGYPSTNSLYAGLLMAGMVSAGLFVMTLRPGATEGKERLLNVLKDADKTDQLIKSLKDVPPPQEYLKDPEIMKNLGKIMDALDGRVQKTLDEQMNGLRATKDMLEDTKPKKNWPAAAIREKGGEKDTGR